MKMDAMRMKRDSLTKKAVRRQLQPQGVRKPATARGRLRRKNAFLVLQHKGKRVINPTLAQLYEWL